MPKGIGSQIINFLVIFSICLGVAILNAEKPLGIGALNVFSLISAYALIYVISFLLNYSTIRPGAFFEVIRPSLMLAVFLLSYHLNRGSENWAIRGVLLASKGSLFLLLLVATVQLKDPDYFDLIWSAEKTRGVGDLVRLTSSMYNPNAFAVIVAFCALLISSVNNIKKSCAWLFVAMLLILLSGSRTAFIAYPVSQAIVITLRIFEFRSISMFLVFVGFLGSLSILMIIGFLSMLGESLPYLSQLLTIRSIDELRNINSFHTRVDHLGNIYDVWRDGGWSSFLFGLGSTSILRVGDNEFISALFRLGIVGVLVFGLVYSYMFRFGWHLRRRWVGAFSLGYLSFALITGATTEVLSSWHNLLYFMIVLGLVSGESDRIRPIGSSWFVMNPLDPKISIHKRP